MVNGHSPVGAVLDAVLDAVFYPVGTVGTVFESVGTVLGPVGTILGTVLGPVGTVFGRLPRLPRLPPMLASPWPRQRGQRDGKESISSCQIMGDDVLVDKVGWVEKMRCLAVQSNLLILA